MSFLSFIRSPNVKQAFKNLFAEFQTEVLADIPAHVATAVAPSGWDKAETSVPVEKSAHDKAIAALSNPKFRFRSLVALAKATGYGGEELEALLIEVGARPVVRRAFVDTSSWGLISRVGPGRGQRPVARVNPAKPKLVELLNDPAYKFRRYETLLDKLGIGTVELNELLDEVEARPIVLAGRVAGNSYGLVSRVGAGPLADDDNFDDDDDGDDGFDDFEDDDED